MATNQQDSVEKVGIGAKLVDQPSATTDEIVESVIQVIDVAGEMITAGKKLIAGIEQIDQVIAQIDKATQQNVALAKEAAAASLQDQASTLSRDAPVPARLVIRGTHRTHHTAINELVEIHLPLRGRSLPGAGSIPVMPVAPLSPGS